MMERYELAKVRTAQIVTEDAAAEPFRDFFQRTAAFLVKTIGVMDEEKCELSLEQLKERNRGFYQDILEENYGTSYGNPAYGAKMLGEYGKDFAFLYAELQGAIAYAHEKDLWNMTVTLELFLEVYSAFTQDEELPEEKTVREILSSYINDYCQDMMEQHIHKSLDPECDFAEKIIMEADLSDLRYLYKYGEFVSDNELGVAEFLNSLSQEEIDAMARTYTEGYRIGFITGRKDMSKKKTVNIRYNLGFERMVRAAILQFGEMGLKPVIYRHATHAVCRRGQSRVGYTGGIANAQYDYDHRQDAALFLDADFVKRKLRALQTSYEKYKDLAAVHGGPACIETFGEKPFSPASNEDAWSFTEAQQKLELELANESGQITNRYIRGDERSFTIIAYPVPEIGGDYGQIFREIVKINTLDYELYQRIQQTIIDTLDTCEWVEIKGQDGNETDLLIHLHTLDDPEKQTNFENCVADVNIPVGEVFTSPVLAGTGGTLHVKKVYLNGLQFKDLKLVFDCGQVIDYTCGNFEKEEDNRKYIEDNILFHHPKLAMGEFAIGTNTTAYVAAEKYGIGDKLPILIAEKMGPHFAVGDTCYSWAEDTPVYNPDGKEIIARDNEISELRKEDVSLAYYGCHTDITIPYDELGSIRVVDEEGNMTSIIEKGRFVLPGTEELNDPFEAPLST
ncbi:aminopeptidase [Ruminococcus sp. 5_1_39BFAA]|uniref:aminopeptidase n=1 Tax=Ruminococcus sp. 5_1_39BFAA TaxID=457412 RepID=UPI003566292A